MPPEILAEAPFNDPRADLILQSSDEVHFRVFKLILSLASPIFSDMFTIPSPPSEKPHDEVQVVHLTEHSTALDVVLRHIYPVRSPKGDTLHYASILAEFARKYQVEALDEFIKVYLTGTVERDPVGVYAIAATYGYKDIGIIAARSCLNLSFSGLESPYLRCITVEHITELHRYHVACGEAAAAIAASDRTWFLSLDQKAAQRRDASGIACQSCSVPDVLDLTSTLRGRPNYNSEDDSGWAQPPKKRQSWGIPTPAASESAWTGRTSPRCMWNYLHRSALVLAHHPSAAAVTTEDFVMKSNGCTSCAQNMRGHVLELSVVLGGEIKKAVEQVSLSSHSPCLRCSMMHSHTWQVPLPNAVSVELSSAATATATN